MNPTDKPAVIAVIPARYASSRFPGKPLAVIAGKSMVQRVVERARLAQRITRTVVATDDDRIVQAVAGFGGEAIETRPNHRTGTERVAEVAAHTDAVIYVNVQGDEPLIDPGAIDALVEAMLEDESIQIATPCVAIRDPGEIMDPNVVKVVRDFDGRALYFSRAPIPWVRDAQEPVAALHWKHIGLYAFRRDALIDFPTLPPGELEHLEQLEQLRWIENGYEIQVVETAAFDAVAVDVPGDVARVEKILQAQQGGE